MDVTTLAAGAAALLLGWGPAPPESDGEPAIDGLRRQLDGDIREFVDRSRADGPDTEQIRCLADLLADRAAADQSGFGAELALVLRHRIDAIAALHALAAHCRQNRYPAGSSWCTLYAHRLELAGSAGSAGYSGVPGQPRRRRGPSPADVSRTTTTEFVVIPSDPAPRR